MAQKSPAHWSRPWRGPLIGVIAASASLAALWGFTVDDALISARMAAHLAAGVGYRFDPSGPVVDAVTPLGFAHLLAPFAASGPLAAFGTARALGALAYLASAALLGVWIEVGGRSRLRFVPLFLLALSAPLGAWASAGMETGLVTALGVVALADHPLGPLAAGMAAAWRPELLPWAMVLGAGGALARARRPAPALFGLALALGPAVLVALVRAWAFGSPMPLAVLAKPAGLDDGLRYALGAALFTGFPALVAAPFRLGALGRHERVVLTALVAHFAAMILAGGDWMPLHRLVVPVLPGFILVGARLCDVAARWATLLRQAWAAGVSLLVLVLQGSASRHIVTQRSELLMAARGPLAGARAVATLDAGWVGIVHAGTVVDLGGVTDPRVAALPGGHTSKRLPEGFLQARGADALVALWDERRRDWFRKNDAWLADQAVAAGYARRAELPLSGSSYRYVVFRR